MPYLSSDVISTVGTSSSSFLPFHAINLPRPVQSPEDISWLDFSDLSHAADQQDLACEALTNMSCLVNAEVEEPNTEVPQGNEGSIDNVRSKGDELMKLNRHPDGGIGWRKIGKILVSRKVIGDGSDGTIVFEGTYEGRLVAVKRLVLKAGREKASNEIQTLINSDRLVRYYGMEADENFEYLALERCICTLDDLIQVHSGSSNNSALPRDPASTDDYKIKLESIRGMMQDVNLWKHDYPSPQLLELMRDMVSGLSYLHGSKIIHRDLKPQNILIAKNTKDPFLVAKLCDMGISRCFPKDKSSLGYSSTGCGTFGWHAPEVIKHKGKQKWAMDLFSLGCVLFFCITCGKHPFGEEVHRDYNIVNNIMDLPSVEFIPEAHDLLSCLLNQDPELRPQASEVLKHPFFWTPKMRLSFLYDVSNEVKSEDRKGNFDLQKALENTAQSIFGKKWDDKVHSKVMANLRRHRDYNGSCVSDLLRAVQNEVSHHKEDPKSVKRILGPYPDRMDAYFAKKFPKLLIETYKVARELGKEELIAGVLTK
ncbi:hypothetical protein BT93_C1222 [Corymbia citriodora subsp. variegata]|nr:hypothetical protein BT93_C1222 [Corymbia citriodora subsp. variegata]